MPTYLTETFELGSPLHDLVASGYGEYEDPGWGTIYPITVGYGADVFANIGKNGTYGLTQIPAYAGDENFWVIFQVFPSDPLGGPGSLTPLIDAGKGRVQFDLKLDSTIWNISGGVAIPLFDLSRGYYDGSYGLGLGLSNDSTLNGGTGWKWYLSYSHGDGTFSQPTYHFPWYNAAETVIANDLNDGLFHRIEVTWQAGTITAWDHYPATTPYPCKVTILSDGWIKLKVDGNIVSETLNLPLIFNEEGTYNDPDGTYHNYEETAINRFTAISLGDAGYCPGIYDNLIIGTPLSDTWVDVANFIPTPVNSALFPGGVGRILCDLWTKDESATIKARLWNDTDSISCGESAEVFGTIPTQSDFAVTLTSGVKVYKVQVSGSSNTDLFYKGAGLVP